MGAALRVTIDDVRAYVEQCGGPHFCTAEDIFEHFNNNLKKHKPFYL
jgi:hypothetical protein